MTNLDLTLSILLKRAVPLVAAWLGSALLLSFCAESAPIDQYGYISATGEFAIPCKFSEASDFHDGLAAIRYPNDRKYSYIDRRGQLILHEVNAEPGQFSEGLARVKNKQYFGFMDKSGKISIQAQYLDAHFFSEGLAAVEKDITSGCSWGFIAKDGTQKISCQFNAVGNFKHGLCPAQKSEKEPWGFIDKSGKFVIKPCFRMAQDFTDSGLAGVETDTKKWGFIDYKGRLVVPAKYDSVIPFNDGKAIVRQSNAFSVIQKDGFLVNGNLDKRIESIGQFHSNLARVGVKGKEWDENYRGFKPLYGFMAPSGKLVIPAHYTMAGNFCEGLAFVDCNKHSTEDHK